MLGRACRVSGLFRLLRPPSAYAGGATRTFTTDVGQLAERNSPLCGAERKKARATGMEAPAPTENAPSFYRRELPAHLVSFTAPEGRQLFREALEEGSIENYFSLVGNFTTQSDVALCGPGSLAMVLNAFEADPGRIWKGIWRWYSDEMLTCCLPFSVMREKGVTFDQFVCLAECHGLQATPKKYDSSTLAEFEAAVEGSCSTPGRHLVVSFSRQALGQTGIGHFSPIAGYHRERRMVLVLDVARFKYPSYWVSIDTLWAAMQPPDPDTGKCRGFIKLSKPPD